MCLTRIDLVCAWEHRSRAVFPNLSAKARSAPFFSNKWITSLLFWKQEIINAVQPLYIN